MSSEIYKGSICRKWDLHVHTPASHINNLFGSDWDEYVKALFKAAIEKDVHAIGLTDYFTIEGYKKIKNEYLGNPDKLRSLFSDDERAFINGMLIVPNIEFRLDVHVDTKKVNLHVLFSDKVTTTDIEQNFLHAIDFVASGGETRKLTQDNLVQLGERLKSEHSNFRDKTDVHVGMMNATVKAEELSAALSTKRSLFKDKYLIGVHADAELSSINWNSGGHQTRKVLIQMSHFLFASNSNTVSWALGRNPYSGGPAAFRQEFHSLKPCIHGSDAHRKEEIAHPCSRRGERGHSCLDNSDECRLRYCWIKSDLTFEGLRQITLEPELRVRIQEDDPSESEAFAMTAPLSINFPEDLLIKDETGGKTDFCLRGNYGLAFSNNLTCLIGGRGTGKSALSHIVYSHVMNKDTDRLRRVNSAILDLDMPPDPLKKVSEVSECNVPAQTEFFFQNEVESLAQSAQSMTKVISQRLQLLSAAGDQERLSELRKKWTSSYSEIETLIEAYDRIAEIDRLVKQYSDSVQTLRSQTEVIKSKDYVDLQAEVASHTEKIALFQSYKSEHAELMSEISSLVAMIERLKWDDNHGRAILVGLKNQLLARKEELGATLENVEVEYAKEDYTSKFKDAQSRLADYLGTKGLPPENIQELSQANTTIAELRGQIDEMSSRKKPFEEIYAKKHDAISVFESSYDDYRNRFQAVCGELQTKLSDIPASRDEVTFEVETDRTQLKKETIEFVKESVGDEAELRADAVERLFFGEEEDIDGFLEDKARIRTRLNESTIAEKNRRVIQELINDDVFLERLHIRMIRAAFNIDNIKVQVKLGGKLLKNTSFGERCGIAISIILVAGTNPILIDQPEDHLDGRFISEVLVPLLRRQKLNRQMILVTRDANIVLGADAELIHILETAADKTQVFQSSIENLEYRDKYIWILDGGKEAFSKREDKYSIESNR